MFILVTGGSGSGKSAYAEQRVLDLGEADRIYIATMICYDEESRRRVERHRKMRAGKGFRTLECPTGLLQADIRGENDGRPVTALLECMSNLTANEMFDPSGSGEDAQQAICAGIDRLLEEVDHLVVVTNEIFSDGITYPEETRNYQELLGRVNCYMASRADETVEVVYGIPVIHRKSV